MLTKLEVCQQALAALGHWSEPALALNDGSFEASVCNGLYDQARRECLMVHPWEFAEKHATITAHATVSPVVDFQYAYAIPAGALRVLGVGSVNSDAIQPADTLTEPFRVDGKNILSDLESIVVSYLQAVAEADSPYWWDAYLVASIVRRLAAPITASATAVEAATRAERVSLSTARSHDAVTRRGLTGDVAYDLILVRG